MNIPQAYAIISNMKTKGGSMGNPVDDSFTYFLLPVMIILLLFGGALVWMVTTEGSPERIAVGQKKAEEYKQERINIVVSKGYCKNNGGVFDVRYSGKGGFNAVFCNDKTVQWIEE